jgi:hypothetical protein
VEEPQSFFSGEKFAPTVTCALPGPRAAAGNPDAAQWFISGYPYKIC